MPSSNSDPHDASREPSNPRPWSGNPSSSTGENRVRHHQGLLDDAARDRARSAGGCARTGGHRVGCVVLTPAFATGTRTARAGVRPHGSLYGRRGRSGWVTTTTACNARRSPPTHRPYTGGFTAHCLRFATSMEEDGRRVRPALRRPPARSFPAASPTSRSSATGCTCCWPAPAARTATSMSITGSSASTTTAQRPRSRISAPLSRRTRSRTRIPRTSSPTAPGTRWSRCAASSMRWSPTMVRSTASIPGAAGSAASSTCRRARDTSSRPHSPTTATCSSATSASSRSYRAARRSSS